ncbi:MAG: hypothetical protein AAF939_07495 [Planctomycetota bacterium]
MKILVKKNRFNLGLFSPKVVLTFGIAAAIIALGWFVGPSGRVTVTEFSPDLISHRTFTYYQWCGIQCTPREKNVWQSDFDAYLHESGYVGPTGNDRWHFIKGFAPGIRGWHGPAKQMCKATGCWNGDDRWVRWSHANPELADVVWPQVISWARQENYNEIAYLLWITDLENATSTEEVDSKILLSIENANL